MSVRTITGGSASTLLPFGGRHVVVERPRVRRTGKGGKEVELPSIAMAREIDPMPAHVAEQVVVGVSTRGYRRSLEPVDESLETRGESKSNVSRALIERTSERLAEFLDRKLDDVKLAVMFIDGIEIAKHAVIIALGVTEDGTKVPLGVWCGSTENNARRADPVRAGAEGSVTRFRKEREILKLRRRERIW